MNRGSAGNASFSLRAQFSYLFVISDRRLSPRSEDRN